MASAPFGGLGHIGVLARKEAVAVPGAPLSVRERPSWLRASYERLILVAHSDDLQGLEPGDCSSLVVSTDWLAWRRWIEKGGHGLHFESALLGWPEELGDPDTWYLRSSAWMEHGGRDVTLFCGVSLGKQFVWQAGAFKLSHARLRIALERLCREFAPQQIHYLGARLEYGFLEETASLDLMQDIAARFGLKLTSAPAAALGPSGRTYPEKAFHSEFAPEPRWRALLRWCLESSMDAVFGLKSALLPKRPRVFVFNNLGVVNSLIDGFDLSGALEPVLPIRNLPKRMDFFLRCWRKGLRLAKFPNSRLTENDLSALSGVQAALDAAWAADPPNCIDEEAMRNFLRRIVFTSPELAKLGGEIKSYRQLLAGIKPSALLVGDAENAVCRILLELAQDMGAETFELLNGLFLTPQRYDSRCKKEGRLPLVQNLLAWGKKNEDWARVAQAGFKTMRTGYPALLRSLPRLASPSVPPRRVLLLPHTVERSDLKGLYAEIYSFLVETSGALADMGFADIRIKVHPGFHERDYYEDLLREHGHSLPVFKDGPLLEHILWADIVVGPVNSGSMVESMALGRPYYPYMAPLNSFSEDLLPSLTVSRSASELADAIRRGQSDEDRQRVLEEFTSLREIEDPAARVWAAISTKLAH